MIGSKDCGKSHPSVNKNNDEDNCRDFFKKYKSGTKNCYEGNKIKITKRTI